MLKESQVYNHWDNIFTFRSFCVCLQANGLRLSENGRYEIRRNHFCRHMAGIQHLAVCGKGAPHPLQEGQYGIHLSGHPL